MQIENKFKFTNSQQLAYNDIITNLTTSKVILLQGSAGTGKSTLTKLIINHFYLSGIKACGITPTHKSKNVLFQILNEEQTKREYKTQIQTEIKNNIKKIQMIKQSRFNQLKTNVLTVASALNKLREFSYIGTKKYSKGNVIRLHDYKLFVIDEISMISDIDMDKLLTFIKNNDKYALLIGDENQIPCPSAGYEKINEICIQKANAFVFNDETIHKINLTEIIRQKADSDILQLATFVKNNLNNDFTIEDTKYNPKYILSSEEVYNLFIDRFNISNINNKILIKIIAYTNISVKNHNLEIRKKLGYTNNKYPFVVNDILTGYNNFGYPELIIQNGQDYVVTSVIENNNKNIGKFKGLTGLDITIDLVENIDLNVNINKLRSYLFFIDIYHDINTDFIDELIKLAEKVNNIGSTKQDYVNYSNLKNYVLFIEDIYCYDNGIYTESTFKDFHPLLFVNINDVITFNKETKQLEIKNNLLYDKINNTYPNLINNRIEDIKKTLGDNENLSDKYKVIEKDIYYGYAITAHKSQGSTYNSVFVDEKDFEKIANKWNYKYDCFQSRIREKNQLKYVAYTRAKEELYLEYDV